MDYKMNMDEVFGMLTNKIAEASYKARITEYLANIGFDSDDMRRESNTLYEHAFAWIEVQNAMSGTENGDDVYRTAQSDASSEILQDQSFDGGGWLFRRGDQHQNCFRERFPNLKWISISE